LARIKWLVAGVCLLLLEGCGTVSYYVQAVGGQMQIWHRSRPIAGVVADEKTDARLRERLKTAQRIRTFASAELGLPDNGSYRKYADLGRPFVVWNVYAAREFSLDPQVWCFPVAGCIAYRGYFKEADAQAFAAGLRAQGLDTFVAGITAYSTLGWFDDPVLNTFVNYPDVEIARMVFHEISHQVVYVKDDSTFNESFATAVELEGAERWLAREGSAAQRAVFDAGQKRRQDFTALVGRYRERLKALYAGAETDAEKRRLKAEAFAALRSEYQTLRVSWGGFAGYDRFFAESINNAHFVPVAAYTDLVPAFRRLLAQSGGDFVRFYARAREIAGLPKSERARILGAGQETGG
jgi:predicted aminopeptidase